MIKVIAPAIVNPGAWPSVAEFQRYWAESHGPLFSETKQVKSYVQHLTLAEAYEGTPKPTHDGASMFWYDDLDALRNPLTTPEAVALNEASRAEGRLLFDGQTGWPRHHKRASVVATERVIVEGATTPEMVKAIFIAARIPGLTPAEFSDHWFEVHGSLAAKLPGLRRYVQNHAIPEAYAARPMTHDGWAELWFDDLASLQAAFQSPEAQALREDGATLFAQPVGVVIARERVQKWDGVSRTDLSWVKALSEDEIRARLQEQGFVSLAADATTPRTIKAAAESGNLAVWTHEHIVTIDSSRIDARPERVAVA
jgi:uncharacterized protein (TIGR02118 family)